MAKEINPANFENSYTINKYRLIKYLEFSKERICDTGEIQELNCLIKSINKINPYEFKTFKIIG